MSKLLIKNVTVIMLDGLLENHSVLSDAGKIVKIGHDDDLGEEQSAEIIDAGGKYLAPGFIDLHFHGLDKYLVDNGADDLMNICRLLPRYGVTGFLPTVCPLPKGEDAEFVKSLSGVKSRGAQILGFNHEGPFLTLTGALPPEALGQADAERVESLTEASKPYKAIFSIAPDFDGILELMPLIAANNTPVFMTHTKANVRQTQAAIEAGARHATHFYDVFPCPQETDPGVRPAGAVEAILADERVSVDFILDGEHVDPVVVKMSLRCKGPDRVCLITDSNVGAGLPPGRYTAFGDAEIVIAVAGGPARMTENSPHPGALAGSGLTMDLAVRNAISMLGVDLPLAVRMATANPAKVIGIDDSKGQIKVGFDADMVLLDNDLSVIQTFIEGKCCYKNNISGD
jgi:N-acetylglucosamine-6-phosphate deacetylase